MSPADTDLASRLAAALDPRPEILEAYLFGSHARGTAGPLSDVDVAVYVDRERADDSGFGYVAALTTDLMTALGTNDLDVVLLNDAPPLLCHRVLTDGVRLLSRDLAATTTREGRALSRYCDDLPRLAIVERALRARIREGRFGT
jgi:predicted nucleotidyltransferase